MPTPFLPFLFLFLLCLARSTADDATIMTQFLTTLTPPPSTWTSTTPYCTWSGITCDTTTTPSRVTAINLQSLSLHGTIPESLNSLTQLTSIALQNNHFTGPIPSFSDLTSLSSVSLNSNNFTSVSSSAFSGLISLRTLSLSDNPALSPWELPTQLVDSVNLVSLYANNVNLVGPIPDIFDKFPGLIDLRLAYNQLNGSLPDSLLKSSLQYLWVNNQGLSGSIDVVSGLTELKQLWLHDNQFTGELPDLTNLTVLFDLQLRDNQLTGIVPNSVISLPNLLNITLENNKLQGPLPGFPKRVEKVEFGNNKFCRNETGDCDGQVGVLLRCASGFGFPVKLADNWGGNDACSNWMGVACDSSGNVISVNLAKQGFNGVISTAFANLSSLQTLVLSGNNLTGVIPESLVTLPHLVKLDVSGNNLTGKLPGFRSGVVVNTNGNPLFGSDPVQQEQGAGSSSGGKTGSKGSGGLVAGIVVAVLVFVVVVMFVLYKCYMKKRNGNLRKVQNPEAGIGMTKGEVVKPVNGYQGGVQSELESQSSNDGSEFPGLEGAGAGNVAISIEVLRQVTGDFNENNIVGRGGFGVVYKGELPDGTKIAVKRMESDSMGTKGMKEFQAEIGVLTKVRHRHLVALLGSCVNGHERLLVYEYMPKGHLGQHLFEWEEHNYPPLTWKQRVTIALDVGRGVEYLYSLAQTSFIHRDLKPSNILLGDNMRAKVADFGLVKNAPDGKYSVETRLAGTFGYLAPEYAVTGRVTTKIDVYAFGVILMELITGRKALDETMPDERSHLVTWFRRILINKDNIRKSIDGILDPDDETYESICRVAELAGHCTAREPHQRPDMGHAVNVLGPLVEQWKPSCQEEDDEEEDESYGIDLQVSLPQALRRWQADEGTSTVVSDISFSQTQGSIPWKPSGFAHSFDSTDCR
ncbi:receptor-like kinase TMK4 [Silene latifolia]|uniref:receptor-like kinase TMK4 n=1 Tax=Silene latifolia TaxID=37657 RepID=UPI003D78795B